MVRPAEPALGHQRLRGVDLTYREEGHADGPGLQRNDDRQVRFVGGQKEINENFAVDLIAEQPVSETESSGTV